MSDQSTWRGSAIRFPDLDRRQFIAGAGAGVVASGVFHGTSHALDAQRRPGVVVETEAGKIRGLRRGEIHEFRGVRYGASTSGANRFMPPVKPARWAGVKAAYANGHQCPQKAAHTAVLAPQADPAEGFSEDCLFLNVWTPGGGDGRKRPVMFWCHGGGFTWESGSWPWVDGAALARRGDVVVVTVNHRLGIFGYLSLAELSPEKYGASGNAAMLDLVLALQWVRDNIERFGGDPGNVTLFGQSGGGAKVGALMSMPAAKGLFHRPVIQSGPWVEAVKQDDATRIGRTFLSELNIGRMSIDQLQRVPADKLLSVKAGEMRPSGTVRGRLRMGMAPVLDGRYLPANPFDPGSPSFSADVPLLIGNTRHETTLFYLPDNGAFLLDEAGLVRRLREGFEESEVKEILGIYRGLNPGISPSEIFFLSTTDRLVRRDTIMTAERKYALKRAPVFVYAFDWRSPALGGKLGATHTVEIPFVFDNTSIPTVMTASEKAAALAAVTSNAWTAFACTGSPQHAGLPAWPAYDPQTRATMVFNDETRLVNDPDGAARAFWASREP